MVQLLRITHFIPFLYMGFYINGGTQNTLVYGESQTTSWMMTRGYPGMTLAPFHPISTYIYILYIYIIGFSIIGAKIVVISISIYRFIIIYPYVHPVSVYDFHEFSTNVASISHGEGCGWDRYLSNAEVKRCSFDPEMGVTRLDVRPIYII